MRGITSLLSVALLAAATPAQSAAEPVPSLGALKLRLLADKTSYLSLEPIRLNFGLANPTDEDYVLQHYLNESAAHLRVYRVLDGGELEPLGDVVCKDFLFCDTGEDTSKPRDWRIPAAAEFWRLYWERNPFPTGQVTLRAAFEPERGPQAGSKLWSNEVVLTIDEPTGADRRAHEFLASTQMVEIGGRRHSVSYKNMGLMWAGNSQTVGRHFIDHYGDSLYSDYVRYSLSLSWSAYAQEEARGQLLRDILGRRSAFPLRAECYCHLMEMARHDADLEQMAAWRMSLEREKLTPADRMTKTWVARVTGYLDDLSESDRRAINQFFAKRNFALDHWVVAALLESIPGGLEQRPHGERDHIELHFANRRVSKSVRVDYYFSKTGKLQRIDGTGSLELWRVGRLASSIDALKKEHGLDERAALDTFVRFRLKGTRLSGALILPSKEEREFTRRID